MSKRDYLIVIDMQKDFIDGSLGTLEARAIVDNVVRAIDAFDGTVLYTLDTHSADYMDTLEGKKLPVMHCVKGTEGWELEPRVAAALRRKEAKGFEKPTFGSYELAEFVCAAVQGPMEDGAGSGSGASAPLHGTGISEPSSAQITLIGLCTDICVASNAILLRAKLPDTVIRVKADCCAGVTPASHEAALTTLSMCQIDII